MNKPEATAASKSSPRRHEDDVLRGTRLKGQPIFFWLTLDSEIINHYKSHKVEQR